MGPEVLWLEQLSQRCGPALEETALGVQEGTPQVIVQEFQGLGGSSGGLGPLGNTEMEQSLDSQI